MKAEVNKYQNIRQKVMALMLLCSLLWVCVHPMPSSYYESNGDSGEKSVTLLKLPDGVLVSTAHKPIGHGVDGVKGRGFSMVGLVQTWVPISVPICLGYLFSEVYWHKITAASPPLYLVLHFLRN